MRHELFRRKEKARIDEENSKMAKRLVNCSTSVSAAKQVHEYKVMAERSKNLSKFRPFRNDKGGLRFTSVDKEIKERQRRLFMAK